MKYPERLPWMDSAVCATTDPDIFFPPKGASNTAAKRACSVCTVRDECLLYALANGESIGVWGGLSAQERRKLRRGLAA